MQRCSLQHVDCMRSHPLRLRRGKALRLDQAHIGKAHRLHRARGGADIARVARPAQHETDPLHLESLKYAPPMHPMLNIAVRAARRAGSIINRAALGGDALEVRSKRANDFVTQVDRAAEQAIMEIVRKAYPDHGFLAEESGASSADAEYRWIIDPLDG